MLVAIGILIGLVIGAVAGAIAVGNLGKSRLGEARQQSKQLLDEAQREAETLRREAQISAREEAVKLRAEIDGEVAEHRSRIVKVEERVLAKEEEIDGKLTELSRREQGLSDRETHLRQLQDEHKQAREQQLSELERISGMTVNEAKLSLLERSEDLVRHELARRVRQMEEEARTEAKRRARNLVADALQRVVVLSSFDGIRREVAKLTLSKLIEDGRIHPARIEDTYYQSKAEIEDHIVQAGEQAVFEANCGEFHEELVKILGRLRYRTSYGQNVLKHTLEVVHLAGIMAAEVGASVKVTKRAALLHDLGKAMTHEIEGSHASISAQLARRYGETQHVVHAIEAHHYEVEPQTVEAVLLIAADAISASRPGARGESLEHYIKRLASLEELAAQKPGVDKVYALQAGREIRVIVRPGEVDDDAAVLLSHEIAREIEDQLEYPGQVKVTVIRESRAVDVARNVTNGGQVEAVPTPEVQVQPDQAA
jgi:ribonuclease Y